MVIHGPVDTTQLTRFANEFQGLLFREGIARTSLQGVENPTIRIAAPQQSLIKHDITIAEIAAAIRPGSHHAFEAPIHAGPVT